MTMVFCMCCHTPRSGKFSDNHQNIVMKKRSKCGLAWLPLSMSALGFTTIIMTYMFAVGSGHISPVLPYISDTGIEYPESSIFSLCMDVVSFLLVLTVYVTYHLIGQFVQIGEELESGNHLACRRVNNTSLVVGIVAATGLSILANFPEDENLMVHLVGAFFCFTFGVAYLFLHTWLSFKTSPEFCPPFMCFIRLSISSFAALTYVLLILFGTALRWHANEDNPQPYYKKISAAFEWILVVTFDMYFVTFVSEFRRIKMSHIFQHYQGGSWVEFAPLSRSESLTQSEETSSTRSSGDSSLTNSNHSSNQGINNSNSDVMNTKQALNSSNFIHYYDVKKTSCNCHHPQNETAYILPTGELCIGWATTV
ncbi:DNA damage-regulated autophagy modulator protein 1-like [Amphiura filiformis]|uniref:DNA damage-regulated autophagy modulator protein 1-like n=1 Tax=Amphiura filiformis TaxID=82378 RepID=UPI003B20F990